MEEFARVVDKLPVLRLTVEGRTYSLVPTVLRFTTSSVEPFNFPCADLLLKLSERLGASD